MYFDQTKEWVFTNENVRLRSEGTDINGIGFDSDRDFEEYEMLAMQGDIEVNN